MSEPTPEQRKQVARLAGKYGRERLAELVGLKVWRLRLLLAEMRIGGRAARLSWKRERPDLCPDCRSRELGQSAGGCVEAHDGSYTAEDFLRDHVGEMSRGRLAREVGKSKSAVSFKLTELGLRSNEARTDLTVASVALLLGWGERSVRRAIDRKELVGFEADGVWRIWPSQLRRWVLEDVTRVQWSRVAREDLLDIASLIAGDWGVSEDNKRAQRERSKRESTKGVLEEV